MNQNARLLNWLESHDGVTQLDAFNALGICRLSERIRELERLGYIIEHRMIEVPSRNGSAHVMQYRLMKAIAA